MIHLEARPSSWVFLLITPPITGLLGSFIPSRVLPLTSWYLLVEQFLCLRQSDRLLSQSGSDHITDGAALPPQRKHLLLCSTQLCHGRFLCLHQSVTSYTNRNQEKPLWSRLPELEHLHDPDSEPLQTPAEFWVHHRGKLDLFSCFPSSLRLRAMNHGRGAIFGLEGVERVQSTLTLTLIGSWWLFMVNMCL